MVRDFPSRAPGTPYGKLATLLRESSYGEVDEYHVAKCLDEARSEVASKVVHTDCVNNQKERSKPTLMLRRIHSLTIF